MLPAVNGRALLLIVQGNASPAGMRGDAVNVVMAAAVGLAAKPSAAKTRMPSRTWCGRRKKLASTAVIGREQLLTAQGSADLGSVRLDAVNVVMAPAVGPGKRPTAVMMKRVTTGTSRSSNIEGENQLCS